jgi:PadR family transcriptional regulator PadR
VVLPLRDGTDASRRESVLAYLRARGGSVASDDGRGLTREMARTLGYADVGALNAVLARLEGEGVVTRDVRGRRTFRIALAGRPATARPRRGAHADNATDGSRVVRQLQDDLSHPRGMLRASILLLLDERPGHGYDLIDRVKPFGFERDDPSRVYRSLRWLENAGFVRPSWETPAAGPARRVYELTPEGRQAVKVAAAALWARSRVLEDHLRRHAAGSTRPTPRKRTPGSET